MSGDTRQELRERLARVLFQRAWLDHSKWDLLADTFRRDADAILSDPVLGPRLLREDLEQVGWADCSEIGAPVLMSMHFTPKTPWHPVYRIKGAPDV